MHDVGVFIEVYKMSMISETKNGNVKLPRTRVGFGRIEVSIPPF